jgi:flagellar hook-associated protein 2
MAAITSSGSVSGLNVADLVSQLVAADRAVADARIGKADTKLTTEFTALSKLKGALSTFQGALTTLKDPSGFQLRKVTVSDTEAFTATATGSAAAGSYDVEVLKLAKAGQLASAPILAGSTAVVGTGTLTLSMGAASFAVTIPEDKKTLADVRDAINSAPNNVGVRATLIKAQDGTRLVLTGTATGTANAVKVTATGGDGGLNQFVYDPPTTTNMTSIAPAQDAEVNIAGYLVKSASNVITDAMDGVTLTLKKADENKTIGLSIANDDDGVKTKVQGFVTAYNAVAKVIADLRSYNAETKTAGPMLGDAMLRGLEAELRKTIANPVAGIASSYSTLATLGITTTSTGALELNATKFSAAMKADPAAASQVFASANGIGKKLDAMITTHLSSTGDITARDAGITSKRKQLDKDKTALDARMAIVQERYKKQFSALDSMLTSMQSTSAYLAKQLGNVPS